MPKIMMAEMRNAEPSWFLKKFFIVYLEKKYKVEW